MTKWIAVPTQAGPDFEGPFIRIQADAVTSVERYGSDNAYQHSEIRLASGAYIICGLPMDRVLALLYASREPQPEPK